MMLNTSSSGVLICQRVIAVSIIGLPFTLCNEITVFDILVYICDHRGDLFKGKSKKRRKGIKTG